MSIEENVKNWHGVLSGEFSGGLKQLLADDVVFLSPVVHTPQKGKILANMYLSAAAHMFQLDNPQSLFGSKNAKFWYVKEILAERYSVLEFEAEVDGKYINGVDIISWNDSGEITEFKVMIRPLQAVHALQQHMLKMLEKTDKR